MSDKRALMLEVADILRRHGDAYRERNASHLSRDQLKVMGAVQNCRTAARQRTVAPRAYASVPHRAQHRTASGGSTLARGDPNHFPAVLCGRIVALRGDLAPRARTSASTSTASISPPAILRFGNGERYFGQYLPAK